MKKFYFVIGVQFLIIIFLGIFSFVQKTEADKQRSLVENKAMRLVKVAEGERHTVETQKEIADRNAAEATKQQRIAAHEKTIAIEQQKIAKEQSKIAEERRRSQTMNENVSARDKQIEELQTEIHRLIAIQRRQNALIKRERFMRKEKTIIDSIQNN